MFKSFWVRFCIYLVLTLVTLVITWIVFPFLAVVVASVGLSSLILSYTLYRGYKKYSYIFVIPHIVIQSCIAIYFAYLLFFFERDLGLAGLIYPFVSLTVGAFFLLITCLYAVARLLFDSIWYRLLATFALTALAIVMLQYFR